MVVDGVTAGYGSVKGKDNLIDRDAVFEFYLIPAYRRYGLDIFRGFISESSTAFIECQLQRLPHPSPERGFPEAQQRGRIFFHRDGLV